MRRFKPKAVLDITEHPDGPFILYSEAIESMQAGLIFAMAHQEEIETGVEGFEVLKPLLDMVRVGSKTH